MATGWLGWSPEIALATPISQIELALAGKIDFIKKTNPFGGGETEEDKMAKRLAEQRPDPDAAARQIMHFVGDRQRKNNRQKSKPKK